MKTYKIWCKGTHPRNPYFQEEGWWWCGDYILNKYYSIAHIFGGIKDEEFFEHFEIIEDEDKN
jgi:hypothetical protein